MVAGGHTSATAVSATTVTFTALAGILTAARIFTRKAIVRTAGVDDVLVLIGMVSSIVLSLNKCIRTSMLTKSLGIVNAFNDCDMRTR